MTEPGVLERALVDAHVDAEVFGLRPDYCVLLLAVDGLEPGPTDQESDALLQAAEVAARQALSELPVEQLPHVASWRGGDRAFGGQPQTTPNSGGAAPRPGGTGPPRADAPP